jgi:hypothetical protein
MDALNGDLLPEIENGEYIAAHGTACPDTIVVTPPTVVTS